MAIVILKRGVVPKLISLAGECSHCGCQVTCGQDDAKQTNDPRDTLPTYYLPCPNSHCQNAIALYAAESAPKPKSDPVIYHRHLPFEVATGVWESSEGLVIDPQDERPLAPGWEYREVVIIPTEEFGRMQAYLKGLRR